MSVAPLSGKALQAVRHSTASINAFEGSVRSGKTFASMLMWMRYARTGPAGPLLMVGRTQRTVKQNLIDPMVEMLGAKRCRYVAGAGVLYLFGRTVYVVGADNEASVTKIQGLTLAGAYVDECATLPKSFFNMLYSRLSIEGSQLFLTSNPAGPQHWLKVDWLNRARLWVDRDGRLTENPNGVDLHRFTFKLEDNPHLPPGYVTRIKSSYTGLFYRRYVNAEWVAGEGAVFDFWDPVQHVVSDLPLIRRWVAAGIDYGTVNPFHAVLLGLGSDGVLYATSEWRWDSRARKRQLNDALYSKHVREWLDGVPVPGMSGTGVHPEWTVVDPSAASFWTQLHDDGLDPRKGDNSVLDGIRLLSSLLAGGQLKIHRSCAHLIDEMPSYSWDEKAAAAGEDAPVKEADHGVDALRYALKTTYQEWRWDLRSPVHDLAA